MKQLLDLQEEISHLSMKSSLMLFIISLIMMGMILLPFFIRLIILAIEKIKRNHYNKRKL